MVLFYPENYLDCDKFTLLCLQLRVVMNIKYSFCEKKFNVEFLLYCELKVLIFMPFMNLIVTSFRWLMLACRLHIIISKYLFLCSCTSLMYKIVISHADCGKVYMVNACIYSLCTMLSWFDKIDMLMPACILCWGSCMFGDMYISWLWQYYMVNAFIYALLCVWSTSFCVLIYSWTCLV